MMTTSESAMICSGCDEPLMQTGENTYKVCQCQCGNAENITVVKCALCRADAIDYGGDVEFYGKNAEGGLVSLRCLCNDCVINIKDQLAIWLRALNNDNN